MTHKETREAIRLALLRAVERLGSARQLARRLQVPEADLARWLAGSDDPGVGIFLQLIDILGEAPRPKN